MNLHIKFISFGYVVIFLQFLQVSAIWAIVEHMAAFGWLGRGRRCSSFVHLCSSNRNSENRSFEGFSQPNLVPFLFYGKAQRLCTSFHCKERVLLHIYMPPKGQFTSKGKANLVHVPGGRQDDTKAICPGFSPQCSLDMDVVIEPACRRLITIKHAAVWVLPNHLSREVRRRG
jgi:hypothetical protein